MVAELESPNFATKLNFVAHMTDYEYILENFRIFVYPRHEENPLGGAVQTARSSIESGLMENFVSVKELRILIEAPYFDISSTAIRRSQGLQ